MATNLTFATRIAVPLPFFGWWRRMERAHKYATAVAILVVCGVIYVCSFLGSYIEEAFGNKAAASTALYMDSFVEPLVQSLASAPSLPPEARGALERLLSPASIGKPIVTFRLWVGNRIVFSNRSELIGRSYPPSSARISATQGDVVATFGPDSEDDEYERSLGVPILEIHAPIRRAGTHEIIAIAETAELASELSSHIRAAQYSSYAVIISFATAILMTLFGFGGRLHGTNKRVVLTEELATSLCAATGRVLESNDRDRRNLCVDLHSGPLQHAAFALLRVEALRNDGDGSHLEIEAIGNALEACVSQLRTLSSGLPPDLNEVPLAGALNMAIHQHVLKTATIVNCEFGKLPHDLPYAIKACLFQFLEEALIEASKQNPKPSVQVSAKEKKERFEVRLCYEIDSGTPERLIKELARRSENLRHRVEALRGEISFKSLPRGRLTVSVSFMLPSNGGA
jgi:signal transduction histidine kinase